MEIKKIGVFFFLMMGFAICGYSQIKNNETEIIVEDTSIKTFEINKNVSSFIVKGTSSLHDWEMISKTFEGSIESNFEEGNLNIKSITIKIESESLKSDKKLMDKKCYEALKSDKFPSIIYQFQNVESINLVKQNEYVATLNGTLTIAGISKNISSLVEIITNGDSLSIKSLNVKGEQPLKMSDFDVTPPTALFGTIKTGNEISIHFNANFKNIKNL